MLSTFPIAREAHPRKALGRCRFCGPDRGAPSEPWDQILAEDSSTFVVPTKGALVSPWVLVVPKAHVLATNQLVGASRDAFAELAAESVRRVGPAALQFEHGPAHAGTAIGCGVDHAHLHVMSFDADFASLVFDFAPELKWHRSRAPWQSPSVNGSSYFAFSADSETWWMTIDPPPRRQFFRQVVASALGCPEMFDYEAYPCESNAAQTAETWSKGR